jgi:hypothetical protein
MRRSKARPVLLLALGTCVVLFAARQSRGQKYWVGPTGGLWSDPANWSAAPGGPGGAGVPQVVEAAIAPSGISAHFDFVYSQPGIGTQDWTAPVVIEQDTPSSVLVAGNELDLPRFSLTASGIARYVQSAGTAILNTSLRLGNGQSTSTAQGFYTLSGNATLSIGSDLFATSGVFTQTGGLCTVTGATIFGDGFGGKTGSLVISGGTFSAAWMNQAFGVSTFSGGNISIANNLSTTGGSIELTGTAHLSAGSLTVSTFDQMTQTGGMLTCPDQLDIRRGGTYQFNGGSLSVGSVNLTDTGTGRLLFGAGPDRVARAGGIAIAHNGYVDLSRGALLVDYGGASPISSLRSYIVSGYNGGSWNGVNGIRSSYAAANAGYAVGYAEASAIFGVFPATFRGESVDNTSVIVATVRTGDANLDGKIDLADFNRLAATFGTGTLWTQGDFNYDGMTNLSDFNLLAGNFGLSAAGPQVTPRDWANLAAAIPEPAAMSVPFAAVAVLARRRRKGLRFPAN